MIVGDKSLGSSVESGPTTIGKDGVIQQGIPSGPPHEGSRETYEGKIISVPKDYCATPQGSSVVIIGYKIWAFQREATNLANTVTQTSQRSHVKGSIIKHCYGDEKGTIGGVCSGTHNGECTPKTWSETVTFEGRNAVRDGDEWWMNNKNTWGVLDYKKDLNQYPTDDPQDIRAALYLAQASGTMTMPQSASPTSAPPSAGQSVNDFIRGSASLNPLTTEMNMIQSLPGMVQDSNSRLNAAISTDQRRYLDQQAQKEGYKKWDDFVSQMKTLAKTQPKTKSNVIRQTGVMKLECYDLNQFLKNKPDKMRDCYIKEYCRQLALQQKAINKMNVNQFNSAQKNFADNGRLNDQGDFKAGLTQGYIDELTAGGMSARAARNAADIAVPLHNPDQVWGNSVVDALGDPNVNSSLGGGAPSRVAQLKDMIKGAPGDSKLNVKLCAELDGKEQCVLQMLDAKLFQDVKELIEDEAPHVFAPIDWRPYVGKVPETLIEIWKLVGSASWGNGGYQTIDPSYFRSSVDAALKSSPLNGESAIPYILSAFGRIISWHPEHGLISIDPASGRNLISKSPKKRREQPSGDIEILSGFPVPRSTDLALYSSAIKKLGRLAQNEIFAFVPALMLGGEAKIDFVEKQAADVHMDILTQTIDFKTFYIEGGLDGATLVPLE